MQVSPMIIMVACALSQHSPIVRAAGFFANRDEAVGAHNPARRLIALAHGGFDANPLRLAEHGGVRALTLLRMPVGAALGGRAVAGFLRWSLRDRGPQAVVGVYNRPPRRRLYLSNPRAGEPLDRRNEPVPPAPGPLILLGNSRRSLSTPPLPPTPFFRAGDVARPRTSRCARMAGERLLVGVVMGGLSHRQVTPGIRINRFDGFLGGTAAENALLPCCIATGWNRPMSVFTGRRCPAAGAPIGPDENERTPIPGCTTGIPAAGAASWAFAAEPR